MSTPSAVVVEVVRSPIGRSGGILRNWHPVDLTAELLRRLVERVGLDPSVIDDVVLGCVMPIGEQGLNLARQAVLAAGWPEHIAGMTVDLQAASGQAAIHTAAHMVVAGAAEVVVAGGVDSASRVPVGATAYYGPGKPFGERLLARYAGVGGLVPPGGSAEMLADLGGLTRADLDNYALCSHQRARAGAGAGRSEELVPLLGHDGGLVEGDEALATSVTAESLGLLKPLHVEGGRVTIGNSTTPADGVALAVIASADVVARRGIRARARVVTTAVVGGRAQLALTAGVDATHAVLRRAGLRLEDLAVCEVHESHAAAVVMWIREMHADPERVNPNGGAIALGHPGGATGAAQLARLIGELARREGRYGLLCTGDAGTAAALLVERL